QAEKNAAIDSLPYIVYSIPSDGGGAENIRDISMTFRVVAETYNEARLIRNRLLDLLDQEDRIRNLASMTSDYIYYSKHVGGSEFKDPDIDAWNWALIFDMRYNPFNVSTPSASPEYNDSVNKTMTFHYAGSLIDEDFIINNLQLGNKTITKVGLHLQNAATGADVIVDLTVDDAEQSRLATLSAGDREQTQPTDITNLVTSGNDRLDIKIKQVGSILPGESLTVVVYYR
ncbi:unnamed protein product, partial [marine sediment metagenome]